jgi:hypothetical protein
MFLGGASLNVTHWCPSRRQSSANSASFCFRIFLEEIPIVPPVVGVAQRANIVTSTTMTLASD